MKVNPVGIQSYQQIESRNASAHEQVAKKQSSEAEAVVTIAPQKSQVTSRLAVKAPQGNYADFLTPEEKNALEILFKRFNDPARFGPAYQREADAAGEHPLVGQFIDVKV